MFWQAIVVVVAVVLKRRILLSHPSINLRGASVLPKTDKTKTSHGQAEEISDRPAKDVLPH